MKISHKGYVYEAIHAGDAYAFSEYLGRTIAGFIKYFRDNIVTAGGGFVGDWKKYDGGNGSFKIPLKEVLKRRMIDKLGEGKSAVLAEVLYQEYDLIIDNLDKLTEHNGLHKCYVNRELAKINRPYVLISKVRWRSPVDILRTVEHELVHLYHCSKDLDDYARNGPTMKNTLSDHEVLAHLKGVHSAIVKNLNGKKMEIMSKRSQIIKYNKDPSIRAGIDIEKLKSELLNLKISFRDATLSKLDFLSYVRDAIPHLAMVYPDLIPDNIADEYSFFFDIIQGRLGEMYEYLKKSGFFEIDLNAVEGLT